MEDKELVRIASEVMNSSRGPFLRTVAEAYVRADLHNREILREAWTNVVKKYRLDEEYKKT